MAVTHPIKRDLLFFKVRLIILILHFFHKLLANKASILVLNCFLDLLHLLISLLLLWLISIHLLLILLLGFLFTFWLLTRVEIFHYYTINDHLLTRAFLRSLLAKEFRVRQWCLESVSFILFLVDFFYHVSHLLFVPNWRCCN